MDARQRKQEIIDEIASAFAGVTRDDGVSLHQADVIDDYGTPEQQMAARELDVDETWDQVPDEDIAKYYWVLSHMDPKGLQYYVPAFMTWALRNYDVSDSASLDAIVFALTEPICKKADRIDHRRLAVFTPSQRRAIGHFLEFLCDYAPEDYPAGPISRSLRDFWMNGS